MSKNIDLTSIIKQLHRISQFLRRYWAIISFVTVALIFGSLVLQINLLNHREPTQDAIAQQLQSINRPKIDQSTIDKLQQLQDNNSDVRTLFKTARDNPFQE